MRSGLTYRILLLCFLVVSTTSCLDFDRPDKGILIKNDIRDRNYNVIRIDQIATKSGAKGLSFRLSPGSKKLIPYERITGLRFSRRYATHTQYYDVECPGGLTRGVVMKLIDVHLGRVAGGCKTVRVYKGST
jgi:hypothetical protein